MSGEAVWGACARVVCDVFAAIYGEGSGGAVSQCRDVAVWAQVVYAAYVVVVAMGDQEGVECRGAGA